MDGFPFGRAVVVANTERIDFLADAARTVTDRLTHSNLPGPRTVGKVLARAARGGHLQVHSFDPQGEQLFRRLGTEQTLGDTPGDFLGLVTQNATRSCTLTRIEVLHD